MRVLEVRVDISVVGEGHARGSQERRQKKPSAKVKCGQLHT